MHSSKLPKIPNKPEDAKANKSFVLVIWRHVEGCDVYRVPSAEIDSKLREAFAACSKPGDPADPDMVVVNCMHNTLQAWDKAKYKVGLGKVDGSVSEIYYLADWDQ